MSPFQAHSKQQLSQDGGQHHAGKIVSPLIEPKANIRSLRSIPGNFDSSQMKHIVGANQSGELP